MTGITTFVAISEGENTIVMGAWTARNNALTAICEDALLTLDRTLTPDEFEELNQTGRVIVDDFGWQVQAVALDESPALYS